jgi:pantoate--beta-alanine ligase
MCSSTGFLRPEIRPRAMKVATPSTKCGAAAPRGARAGLGPGAHHGSAHEGHLAGAHGQAQCDRVAVSIFTVRCTGPNEDPAKYPRNFDRDRDLLEREGWTSFFAVSGGDVSRGRSHL